MIPILLLTLVIVGLLSCIRSLVTSHRSSYQFLSLETFLFMVLTYLTVLIGFGIIYTILEMGEHPILLDNGSVIVGGFADKLQTSMYFSAITLLSVGYGDITPIGSGRWIAVIEALIGYIMPALFVLKGMGFRGQREYL